MLTIQRDRLHVHQSRLERRMGLGALDLALEASAGMKYPVPIYGSPRAWAYDGVLIDHPAGWLEDDRVHGMAGFASLSDLISEATAGGKSEQLSDFIKVAVTATTAGRGVDLWNVGNFPPAGGVAGALPGGTVLTKASTGALPFTNGTDYGASDQKHITTMIANSTVASQMLILYDRLWHVAINIATASNNITGVPTRYQTALTAPGNFVSAGVTTIHSAVTPTATYTYVDQDGNAAQAGSASAAMVSASAVGSIPWGAGVWRYYGLAAGDTGVRNLTNSTLSVTGTGVHNLFIGHILAFIPLPLANTPIPLDGVNSMFNLQRVYDDACLALLNIQYAVGTPTLTLQTTTVAG